MPREAQVRQPLQARARRTRLALVEAARREFAAKGYAATTAKSVTERAGVATGSFYQYFADKDAVLREIAAANLGALTAEVLAVLEAPAPESQPDDAARAELTARLAKVVHAVLRFRRADPGLLSVLRERRLADPRLDAAWVAGERALIGRLVALLERWCAPADHAATALVLFGMVDGAVEAQVGDSRISDERFHEALLAALVRVAWGERKR
jgi:AcrR family transcriptional regulator